MTVVLILGTKSTIDQKATARRVRHLRLNAGVQAKDIASFMGITPQFYSDLELGRRDWNDEKAALFTKALRSASAIGK